MIDCDSLCFNANGKCFVPEVTTYSYLPPELQDLTSNKHPVFSEKTDSFMLAILIWQLMLYNSHPFQRGYWNGKCTGSIIPDNIAWGDSLFEVPENGYPDAHAILPPSTLLLFQREFSYTHTEVTSEIETLIQRRPLLQEWENELSHLSHLKKRKRKATKAKTEGMIVSSFHTTRNERRTSHKPFPCDVAMALAFVSSIVSVAQFFWVGVNDAEMVYCLATVLKYPICVLLVYIGISAITSLLLYALCNWKWAAAKVKAWMPIVLPGAMPIIVLHGIGLYTLLNR